MHLKVLLPNQIFIDQTDVTRIVAQTPEGSFGLLPHRLDCVAVITPGILTFATAAAGEVFIAVDQGLFIKAGQQVFVSVRKAIKGSSLAQLHNAVEKEFAALDEQQQQVRKVMAKMESGFLHRFIDMNKQQI